MGDFLQGRWRFIAAEQHGEFDWLPSRDYVSGMIWDFRPNEDAQGLGEGEICESAPNCMDVMLAYRYSSESMELVVGDLDGEGSVVDESVYSVELCDLGTEDHPIVLLSYRVDNDMCGEHSRYHLQRL